MFRPCPAVCFAVLLAIGLPPARAASWQPLKYAPAPVDNPLKGLVPYRRDVRDRFPHSMEFAYLPYSALVKGYDEFEWRPLEAMLDDVAGRGHQAKMVQEEVMTAYEAAFQTTHVLLRYPAGENNPRKAANSGRRFGYHDDSFAWATLHTGRRGDEWFYMTALKAAGPGAEAKWKTHPIGGEIRPEAWGRVFDDDPGDERIQNFRECVEATHVTWLMDSGMFAGKQQPPERVRRAKEQVRRMGYEFHCPRVSIGKVRGGAGSLLGSTRRGQSHFRGGNGGSSGEKALCAAKIGTVPP